MIYFGLAMLLAIAYFIDWLEKRSQERQTRIIEQKHKQMYALIDEHCGKNEARERKAQVDAMIGALYKNTNREYKPTSIKQVTTAEEREKRIRKELNGTAINEDNVLKARLLDALDSGALLPDDEEHYWRYMEHAEEEKIEHLAKCIMRDSDGSKEEAGQTARNLYEQMKMIQAESEDCGRYDNARSHKIC